MKKVLWIIFILLILAGGAAACYFYWPQIMVAVEKVEQYFGIAEPEPEPEPTPQVIEIEPKQPPVVATVKPDTLQAHELKRPKETTNELVYFAGEEEHDGLTEEDEMLLGKWQNILNPQWYRVYTDEEAKDGYYWGYEWDEAEDITADDLKKYGNGWFMWKKRGSKVLELATADNEGQLIPRPYTITKLFYTELVYKEANSGKKQNFQKVPE